jgi:hypothetical protein
MRIASASNSWSKPDSGTRSASSAWNAPDGTRASNTWT